MRILRARLRLPVVLAAAVTALAALVSAPGAASAHTTAPGPVAWETGSPLGGLIDDLLHPKAAATGLASTIALDNCSGSYVRYPTSSTSDRGMLLTNGHCYEGGFLADGEVLTDVASSRRGTMLDDAGRSLGTVRADRVLYATMTGTDVTLYRLNRTFAQITSSTGATPLTISDQPPAVGQDVTIPSSYWKTTYTCGVDGFVPELREGEWTWHDAIRYTFPNSGCETIHGTSGSPILDADRSVVGINNTGNDDGESCTVNNPCEVAEDGTTSVTQGQNYGEQTYWFTTCLTAANAIDLDREGCLLTSP